MEITWHGNKSLTIKGNKSTVLIDPEELKEGHGDVVISTTEQEDYKGLKVFDWPGEYEIKGIPVVNMRVWTAPKDDKDAKQTLISKFEIDDIKFCHLGDLGHNIADEMSDKIGDIDILIVPVEGNLKMKVLQTIIDEIEPRAILPVQYSNLDNFLKEMSAGKIEAQDVYKLKGAGQFAEDRREYIVLNKN